MQMVIDISEKQYELVRHGNKSYTTELELMNAVAKGTPLPKGHGRLIDLNDLYDFDRRKVEYAPTIIERSDSE